MYLQAFPFISVAGNSFERGRQHGVATAGRIRKSIQLYDQSLAEINCSPAEKSSILQYITSGIVNFCPDYIEEMKGIADGAQVPLDDIVLINARTEVMGLAKSGKRQSANLGEGCTGAVILPERSSTKHLYHGQNWDWRSECAETAIILRIKGATGPDILTFAEAGALARSGLNSAGIAITANNLDSDRDFKSQGIPLPLIRRKALEQEHLAVAMKIVAATPKTGSNNMILSSSAGFAIDFECAPDESFPIYPSDGLLVHANHWISPVANMKIRDPGKTSALDSLYRDWRVRHLLDSQGQLLSADDLKQAFFDDFGTPYAVCRPPRPPLGGNLTATVATIVMEPHAGIMDVAPLPALNRGFTRYSLAEEPVSIAA